MSATASTASPARSATVALYFKTENEKRVLYIRHTDSSGVVEIPIHDYVINAWNNVMTDRQLAGKSLKEDDVALEFAEKIRELKSLMLPCLATMEFRQEITRVATVHLEMVWKLMDKHQRSKTRRADGVYPVAIDIQNKKILCLTCRKPLDKPLKCSRCLRVSYCSAECSRADWKDHKKICCVPCDTK